MVKSRDKILIWVFYLVISFGLMIYAMNKIQLNMLLAIDYILFLLLGILVTLFPIRGENGDYSIGDGVFLVVFIIYGIVPAFIVSAIAVFTSLRWSEVKWDKHYRYPLNLLMIILMIAVSAGAYNLTETLLEAYNIETFGLLPILIYLLVNLYVNKLFVISSLNISINSMRPPLSMKFFFIP